MLEMGSKNAQQEVFSGGHQPSPFSINIIITPDGLSPPHTHTSLSPPMLAPPPPPPLSIRIPSPPPPTLPLHMIWSTNKHKQNVVVELAKQADDDESALLLGLRQDVLDHVQYLDSFSYNNVFVGEERQILGTKIDFDTPRMGELRFLLHSRLFLVAVVVILSLASLLLHLLLISVPVSYHSGSLVSLGISYQSAT